MTVQASLAGGTADSVARLRATLGSADRPLLGALDWVAALPSTAAPGFVYLAGACAGVPVGGGGCDLAEAAGRLAGETAEVLAQQAGPALVDLPGDPVIDAFWAAELDAPRIAAANLAHGRRVGVPAAAVHPGFARPEHAPPTSLGLAAGPDRGSARLAGLLELIERDAAAAWWRDGAPAHLLDAALAAQAAKRLERMRRGVGTRATSFLDLPSPTGVPVVCALSCDADGGGLACGLKAALDPGAAAASAMLELLQMEIALELARLRAARRGPAPGDAGPLARAGLDSDGLAARPARVLPVATGLGFGALAAHLARMDVEVTVADLPERPGGLAVAKVFAPALRPLPGDRRSPNPAAPGARVPLL